MRKGKGETIEEMQRWANGGIIGVNRATGSQSGEKRQKTSLSPCPSTKVY
jgi:hypothetical protein